MNSSIRRPNKSDPALAYAPPRVRNQVQPPSQSVSAAEEEQQTLNKVVGQANRAPDTDRTAVKVLRGLSLQPSKVAEPKQPSRALWPMVLQMCTVWGFAAIVAWALVTVMNARHNDHVSGEAQASSPSFGTSRAKDSHIGEPKAEVPVDNVAPFANERTQRAPEPAMINSPGLVGPGVEHLDSTSRESAPLVNQAGPQTVAPNNAAAVVASATSSVSKELLPEAPAPALKLPPAQAKLPEANEATPPPPPTLPPAAVQPPPQETTSGATMQPVTPQSNSNGLTPDEVAALMRRGKDLLMDGDFVSARLLLRRAAESGSAEAALALGSTYDPLVVHRMGAFSIKPDIDLARIWYQKAADLGSSAAALQLANLARAR
jgi:hypothetical protein